MLTLYRGVVDQITKIIDDVTEADLARPTPCQGWDLRTLLAHQLGQLDGFAEAISAGAAPPASFERDTVESDLLGKEWRRSSIALLDAVQRAPGDKIIQLAGFGQQPVAVMLRMQLLDTAVHGWDIARSIGAGYRPDDAVVADILRVAEAITARPEATTVFEPPVTGSGADDWVAALRLLGRHVAADGSWQR